jgi:Animal haem peroxidase
VSSRHAAAPRGLIRKHAEGAPKWGGQGRFGRLFELDAAQFGQEALDKLATAMVAGFDPPRDGRDEEESGIPALYTYFGQFVDHDLTFDPEASFQKKKDVNALVDFRTPAFDLDSVYGRGPGDQPYMYDGDGTSFELGDPLSLGDDARDLLRSPAGRALIGDPRNDENAIVSQLHGLFQRFHNRLVRDGHSFDEAQLSLCHHYQYVVLHDFLPRIVSAKVLDGLKTGDKYDPFKLRLVDPTSPFMPVEFSGACYRYGHSMVRPGYRLNDAVLVPVFPVTPKDEQPFPEGLTGSRRMISDWGIDWGRFIDVELRRYNGTPAETFKRLQLAYRIDTSLVDPLGSLPPAVVAGPPRSLARRNLERGRQLKLPSGQAVATAMREKGLEVEILPDDKILVGKAIAGERKDPIVSIDEEFHGNCPLWTYVLAEAMQNQTVTDVPVEENRTRPPSVKITTPQLGPVGGRIVAEVILGLMFADLHSLLVKAPDWVPDARPGYRLKDFVNFALGK